MLLWVTVSLAFPWLQVLLCVCPPHFYPHPSKTLASLANSATVSGWRDGTLEFDASQDLKQLTPFLAFSFLHLLHLFAFPPDRSEPSSLHSLALALMGRRGRPKGT